MNKADAQLLLRVVRLRFLFGYRNAIVTAIEGLEWLTGNEESVITRKWLEQEAAMLDAAWEVQREGR